MLKDVALNRPGMRYAVRSKDGVHFSAVFDFPDRVSHEVDWDPATLQSTLAPLISEIKAILQEAGPEALVFITADHGHILTERASAIWLNEAEDVGCRSAYVLRRVEGREGMHLFQIPAQDLGHKLPGLYVFPKPGYALRHSRADRRAFRPDASNRHGGISM